MRALDGLSILLLEDEYLIALDAEDILTSLGAKQIRIVNNLPAAAEAAENGGVDLAILDLNINGTMSLAVAQRFRERGTPIVFASGYELRDRISAELEQGDVYLRKPYTPESLKVAVETALKEGPSRVASAPEAGSEIGK
jgi:CheY-like chemotaxis protein